MEEIDKREESKKSGSETGGYIEPTNYNASQESENFGERMTAIHGEKMTEWHEEDRDEELRRSF
jgi:hypothetical protein